MIYQKTDLWTSITDKRNTIFRYGIIFKYLNNTVPNSTLSFINGIFYQLQFFVLREPMPRFVAHEAKSMIGFHGLERVEPDMCKLGMHGLRILLSRIFPYKFCACGCLKKLFLSPCISCWPGCGWAGWNVAWLESRCCSWCEICADRNVFWVNFKFRQCIENSGRVRRT